MLENEVNVLVFVLITEVVTVLLTPTLTVHVAVLPARVAEMVAVPRATPVTTPLPSTVAMFVSEEDHSTTSPEYAGVAVYESVVVPPTRTVAVVGEMDKFNAWTVPAVVTSLYRYGFSVMFRVDRVTLQAPAFLAWRCKVALAREADAVVFAPPIFSM